MYARTSGAHRRGGWVGGAEGWQPRGPNVLELDPAGARGEIQPIRGEV